MIRVGNLCPPAHQNTICGTRPFVADVKVVDEVRRQVTSFRSGIDGHFQISLAPGTYVLVPVNPTANTPPGAAPVTITVVAGRYSVVDIQYDTGIS